MSVCDKFKTFFLSEIFFFSKSVYQFWLNAYPNIFAAEQ